MGVRIGQGKGRGSLQLRSDRGLGSKKSIRREITFNFTGQKSRERIKEHVKKEDL